ncbi:hypothetical protein PSYCG_00045 (plasmid) [Psychrobacter sp. G]|nr:hypothetical protein PSYCG_00045 [Psychrobacter sp. G]
MSRQIRTLNDDRVETLSEIDYMELRQRVAKAYADDSVLKLENELKTYRDFSSIIMSLDNDDARALLYSYEELVNDSTYFKNIDKEDYKNLLLYRLKSDCNSVDLYNDIIMHKAKYHTPVDYLTWFKDDLRSSIFLASTLEESLRFKISKGGSELQQRIYDLLRFDIDSFNNGYKMPRYDLDYEFTEEDRRLYALEYVKFQYLNSLAKPKDISWIDTKNSVQINKIYTQLDKMGLIPLKTSFLPISLQDKYSLILVSLDRLLDLKSTKGKRNTGSVQLSRNKVVAKLKKNWQQKLIDDRNSADKLIEVKIYKTNHQKMIELLEHEQKTPNQLVNGYIEQEYNRIFSGNLQTNVSLKAISGKDKQRTKVDKQKNVKSVKKQCYPRLPTITNDDKQEAIPIEHEQINHTLGDQEQTANYARQQVTHTKEPNEKFESQDDYQDDFQFEKQLSNRHRGWN